MVSWEAKAPPGTLKQPSQLIEDVVSGRGSWSAILLIVIAGIIAVVVSQIQKCARSGQAGGQSKVDGGSRTYRHTPVPKISGDWRKVKSRARSVPELCLRESQNLIKSCP